MMLLLSKRVIAIVIGSASIALASDSSHADKREELVEILFLPSRRESVTAIFSLQDTAGVCNNLGGAVGCSDDENIGVPPFAFGNPNDIVNCFKAEDFGVSPPFYITAVRVWIGDSPVLTPDLHVNVWAGFSDGSGPDPDRLLYSEEPFGYTFGENIFQLDKAAMTFSNNVCVGVTATASYGGLRIGTDDGGTGESSFLRSPACGVDEFLSLQDLFLETPCGGFCIEAIVTKKISNRKLKQEEIFEDPFLLHAEQRGLPKKILGMY